MGKRRQGARPAPQLQNNGCDLPRYMMRQRLLIKMGCTALMLLVGLGIILAGFHQIGLINAWQLPLKPIGVFLGGGGLACLIAAWISRKRRKQWILITVLIAVMGINVLAYLGAYTATHVKAPGQFGLGLPRPNNPRRPSDIGLNYVTQRLAINQAGWLESWFIPVQDSSPQGTVLLFPGNGGSKGKQLLAPAQVFHDLGYDTLLVDFQGMGGSSGNTRTIGAQEAKEVALAMRDAQLKQQHPIVLYGVSMGTAAILRAIAQDNIKPDAIILELPFARLLDAVKSRLRVFKIPTFPTAELLVFWGSVQHGFNGFAHNPVTDASQVRCPTLIFHGQQDQWTTMTEINELYRNLRSPKQLVIFPNARHHLLVTVDRERWSRSVEQFLVSSFQKHVSRQDYGLASHNSQPNSVAT